MKRNVSVVCVCSAPNCCDTGQRSDKIIKEMPGSVASGTPCICAFVGTILNINNNVSLHAWNI